MYLFYLRCVTNNIGLDWIGLDRYVDIFREFTADASGVYLSGLPVLHDDLTPPVPPGCSPMPSFTYSYDAGSVDFGRQSGSYIAYNISDHESLLPSQCVYFSFYTVLVFKDRIDASFRKACIGGN